MDGMTFGSTVQKLVVIGNGMAGARAVEEVLARGGAEQFSITMFGDEPYGNYNRILLSNILSGAQDASEINFEKVTRHCREHSAEQEHGRLPGDVLDVAPEARRRHSRDGRRGQFVPSIFADRG